MDEDTKSCPKTYCDWEILGEAWPSTTFYEKY